MPVKAAVAETSHSSSLAGLVSTAISRQFGSAATAPALASRCTKKTTPMTTNSVVIIVPMSPRSTLK